MKKINIILIMILTFSIAGGLLAFKENKSALILWQLNEAETLCVSISPTRYELAIPGIPTVSFTMATTAIPLNIYSCRYTITVRPE